MNKEEFDKLNDVRIGLIIKKYSEGISSDEAKRLEILQEQVCGEVERRFPRRSLALPGLEAAIRRLKDKRAKNASNQS